MFKVVNWFHLIFPVVSFHTFCFVSGATINVCIISAILNILFIGYEVNALPIGIL